MRELSPRAVLGALAAAALLGTALRAAGLWTDLWLDEIWNINIARGFGYADILLRVPYDANHILNTLWLRLVGEPAWWGVYRLHSLAAGVATLGLAWRIAERWGRLEGVLAAGLVSTSYLLTLYSSEARGHAMMVCFAAAAFLCHDRWLATRSRAAYAGWAASATLGLLSHLMFVQAYAALALWSAWSLARREGGPARAARAWGLLHAPALAACGFVYWVQVRAMGHAGGGHRPTAGVLRDTLAAAVGCPDGPWAWGLGALALAAAGWAVRDLARRGEDEWVFFAAAVFGAPALLAALHPPGLLFPRYFLLAAAFAAPLWARAGAAGLKAGGAPAAAALAALLCLGGGNLWRTREFLREGRGHYLNAVRLIAERSGPETTVGSGHDFAHRMMLEFYAARVPGLRLRYVLRDRWTAEEPEWAIVHLDRRGLPAVPELTARTGVRYVFVEDFRTSDHVGWDWLVFRRAR